MGVQKKGKALKREIRLKFYSFIPKNISITESYKNYVIISKMHQVQYQLLSNILIEARHEFCLMNTFLRERARLAKISPISMFVPPLCTFP